MQGIQCIEYNEKNTIHRMQHIKYIADKKCTYYNALNTMHKTTIHICIVYTMIPIQCIENNA